MKYVILFIFLIMLSTTLVSAELNPFANKKLVDEAITLDKVNESDFMKAEVSDYPIIKISKTFLWIPTDKIAEYKLTDNNEECFIDCEATGKAILYQKGVLFDDIEFKDKIGNVLSFENNLKYYILINESYEVDVPDKYIEVCKITPANKENNTEEEKYCYQAVDTYKKQTEYREVWKEYNKEVLNPGNYEWKISVKKDINKIIDFIPIKDNVKFSEWAWWNSTWNYRKNINITGDTELLNNFTVYLNISYNESMQSNFNDLRFVEGDCSGVQTNELKFEKTTIVNNNYIRIWIKIPTLNAGNLNTTICMYYNSSTNTDGSDMFNAWDNGYMSVFHLEEDKAPYVDSKQFYNLTTNKSGARLSKKATFGNSTCFSTSSVTYGASTSAFLMATNNFAIEVLQNITTYNGAYNTPISFSTGDGTGGWNIGTNGPSSNYAYYYTTGWQSATPPGSGTGWATRLWMRNESGIFSGYNGSSWGSAGANGTITKTDSPSLAIGGAYARTDYNYVGCIDEVRISNVSRTGNWIRRSVANSNESKYSFGIQESAQPDDSSYPQFSNFSTIPSNNSEYRNNGAIIQINSNITSTNGTTGITWNNVNYTATNITNVFYINLTGIAVGTYTYFWWGYGNGSNKLYNSSSNLSYVIIQNSSYNMTIIGPSGFCYQESANTTNQNGNDGDCGLNYSGTYSISGPWENSNPPYSPVDYYKLYDGSWSTFLNGGYNSDNYLYINYTIPIGTILLSSLWEVKDENGTRNITLNSNCNQDNNILQLRIQAVYGNEPLSGIDSYTCYNGTGWYQLYSAVGSSHAALFEEVMIWNVSSINYGTINYGTQAGISNSSCPSQITCNLYRNGTGALTTPDNTILGAGSYNYTFNSSGNTNYTSKNTTFLLTINKANSQTSLTFDKTPPQIYPTSITPNCSLITGVGSISLTNATSGSPIVLGVNNWNINCSYQGNNNYTASSNTTNYVINQNTSNCSLYFNISSPQEYLTKFKVLTDCSTSYILTRNGTSISNNSEQSLNASMYNFSVIRNDRVNYSNNFEEVDYIISKADPSITIDSNNGWNLAVGGATTITGGNCPGELTCNLYKDGNITTNPKADIYLSLGTFIFSYNTTGNNNYNDYNTFNTLIISATGGTTSNICKYRTLFGYNNLNNVRLICT